MQLPGSFWKIKTLRHVFGTYLILPKRVGVLKHLQTLETVKPDDQSGWDRTTFADMARLESLYTCRLSAGNLHALSAAVSKLEYLVLLTAVES